MNRCAASTWANTSGCKQHWTDNHNNNGDGNGKEPIEGMKQSLQLRTSQHLALTPQLQQSIRLLQLSTLELHQELEQLLTDNPLLERLDDPLDNSVRLLGDGAISGTTTTAEAPPEPGAQDAPAAPEGEGGESGSDSEAGPSNEAEGDWGELGRSKNPDDEDSRPQLEASATSLREHLSEQVRVTVLALRDRALVELIIDALDDNGYLDEPLEEIHARLPEELDIDFDELRTALSLLQSFDPAGVGARNASECLALQIKRMPGVPMVTRRMALAIVENHLTWFAQREFNKLKKALDCDDEDLREAQTVIRACNPHPASAFATDASDFVVPDVIVRKAKGGWSVSLNHEVMPRLRVNSLYATLLKQGKGEGPDELAAAGSQVADQEHAPALRHDLARGAGHRRAPAQFFLPWRGCHAAPCAARNS